MSARAPTRGKGLTPIAGVAALPPAGGAEPYRVARVDGPARQVLERANLGAAADAVVQAGWSFVGDTGPAGPRQKVYATDTGRLALAGRALNVKFTAKTSPSDINDLLAAHHLRKRRALRFGSNLMIVEAEEIDADPISLSDRLASDPRVEFAEPVFVEQIEHR